MRTIVGPFSLLILLSLDAAYAQRPMRLLLGQARAIDKGVDLARVEPSAFRSALRFILGADPALQVGDLGETGTAPDGYQLTSTLQSLRDSVLWAGELRRAGQDVVARSAAPIPLGPVVLADEKGLKPNALVEIAALIKRQLSQEILTPSMPVSIYACLRPDASIVATQIAEEFRLSFTTTLSAADLVPLQPPPLCDAVPGPLPENTARVVGNVTQRDQTLSIEPLLEWKQYAIPLPIFIGDTKAVLKLGSSYVRMLSRATVAAFRQYPIRTAEFFLSENKINWRDDTRYFFGLNEFPYLMVAALQRRDATGAPQAENAYEIGRAFVSAKELEFAKSAFDKALELRPGWIDASRELGAVLFELQRYDEAEAVLKKALDQAKDRKETGIQEKYAQVVFLLGKKDAAGEVLDDMFKTTVGTFSTRLLAVRIALDQSKLDVALHHIGIARNLQGADPVMISRLARDIANAALDNPSEKQQLEFAAAALDLIPETKNDVQLFALKGSVQLKQGLRSDGKSPEAREFASKNIFGAIGYYRKVVENSAAGPEYEAIGLDISEALYFAASYEQEQEKRKALLIQSAEAARDFQKKDDPRGLGLASYQPVAQLLLVTTEYLLDPSRDPRPDFARWIERTAAVPEGPHLSVVIPTGKDNAVVKVGQWSFDAFDTNACKMLPLDRRTIVRNLSDQTQKKVNAPETAKPC